MKIFNGKVEEDILNLLFSTGPLFTREMIERIRKKRGGVSKQGVYRVLRKLLQEEKIVIYKSAVSLSDLWLEKLQLLLEERGKQPTVIGDLSYLKEGEKISLKVKSLTHVDQIWSHIFRNIERSTTSRHPLYLFNPHNWFIILREETEKLQLKTLRKKQRLAFLTIGGETTLDQETAKRVRSKSFEVSLSNQLQISHYVAVVGDYLIQVKLLTQGNQLIDAIFKQQASFEGAREALTRADKKISSRISIEKNKKKAKRLKKKLSHDFFIPRALKDF